MTGAQRTRLERRMTSLVGGGARPDRAGSVRDRELALLVAALNHGRRQPATRRSGTTKTWGVQHATSPIHRGSTPARPLFNVSDVGGYYRPVA